MRLFIGLPLGEAGELRVEGIRSILDEGGKGIAWVSPSLLHLTISFLGETDEIGLQAAREALRAVLGELGPPRFDPRRLGYFPEGSAPRVFILGEGKNAGNADLAGLRDCLCRALSHAAQRAGLRPLDGSCPEGEKTRGGPWKPFSPHITLARIRHGASRPPFPPQALKKVEAAIEGLPPLILDRLVLFESKLRREGPIYIPREEGRFRS